MKEFKLNIISLVLIIVAVIMITSLVVVEIIKYHGEGHVLQNTNVEEVKINSEYGEYISSYINRIWLGLEIYDDNIAEFQNIKSAPKDYLAACAVYDLDDSAHTFADYKDSLIRLFGKEADGLIQESDIENVFSVEKTTDGTYYSGGFCGSEIHSDCYVIDKISKQNNIFTVTLLEYTSILDGMLLELEEGKTTQRHIYDKNDNLILTTTIKTVKDGDIIRSIEYDENGNEINSIEHLLLTKYIDKLSVRNVQLEHDSSNFSFVMVSNELLK